MRRKNNAAQSWLEFSIFDDCPGLTHGVFTRAGGLSGEKGTDLNLAFSEGDAQEKVRENIARATAALGLSPAAFVRQTHSDRAAVIRPGDNYHPAAPEDALVGYDAMIAPEPGVNFLIKLADCQGIILFDPRTDMLALVHSGWRGSVQNIIGRTIEEMERLGADPGGLRAGISPSLGPCCAEFKNYREELPESFRPFMVKENHFDFWAISRSQMTAAGLKPENIETASICTKCSPDFFSYRGGDVYGRFGIMAECRKESVNG